MKAFILAVSLLVFLVGCDSANDAGDLGSFQAQITGAANLTMQGVASFASGESEGFGLVLAMPGPDGISVYRQLAGRPGTGSYEIGTVLEGMGGENFWASVLLLQAESNFSSTSGTLQISSSTRSELVGTLQFQASGDAGGEITVTATFQARCTEAVGGRCD